MQLKLLVTLYDFLIIVLPALKLARSFIIFNTMIGNKSKRYNIIVMYFLRSWSDMPRSETLITEKIKILVQKFVFVFHHCIQLKIHDETSGYTFYNQTICIQKSIVTPHLRELSSEIR